MTSFHHFLFSVKACRQLYLGLLLQNPENTTYGVRYCEQEREKRRDRGRERDRESESLYEGLPGSAGKHREWHTQDIWGNRESELNDWGARVVRGTGRGFWTKAFISQTTLLKAFFSTAQKMENLQKEECLVCDIDNFLFKSVTFCGCTCISVE
jgi:hypothetical protein